MNNEFEDHMRFDDNERYPDSELMPPPVHELHKEVVRPVIEASKSTTKLEIWAITILVGLAILATGVSLAVSKNLSDSLSNRTPTLQYYACRDRRQALYTENSSDYDDAKQARSDDFTTYIFAIIDAARNQPAGFDVSSAPTVAAARDTFTKADKDKIAAKKLRDAAQESLTAATDPKAPAPEDYLMSLKPYATTRCPSLPVKD